MLHIAGLGGGVPGKETNARRKTRSGGAINFPPWGKLDTTVK